MSLSLIEYLCNETGHNVLISLPLHLSLQVHIQTIGILVSEKSELQTALQYTQHAARQKAGVCEDYTQPLKGLGSPRQFP